MSSIPHSSPAAILAEHCRTNFAGSGQSNSSNSTANLAKSFAFVMGHHPSFTFNFVILLKQHAHPLLQAIHSLLRRLAFFLLLPIDAHHRGRESDANSKDWVDSPRTYIDQFSLWPIFWPTGILLERTWRSSEVRTSCSAAQVRSGRIGGVLDTMPANVFQIVKAMYLVTCMVSSVVNTNSEWKI